MILKDDDEGKVGVVQNQHQKSKHKKQLSKKMMKIQPLFNILPEVTQKENLKAIQKAKSKMSSLNAPNQFVFGVNNFDAVHMSNHMKQ